MKVKRIRDVKIFRMVPRVGIEPTRFYPADFESAASTNFTTAALGTLRIIQNSRLRASKYSASARPVSIYALFLTSLCRAKAKNTKLGRLAQRKGGRP